MPDQPPPLADELRLLEHVHMALGSAHKLDDFHAIVAGLLVEPATFGFSRAFIIRFDEKTRQFHGRIALGAATPAEHAQFRAAQEQEQTLLQGQIAEAEQESPEPVAVQHLYDLQFHTLTGQLLQGQQKGMGLNSNFLTYRADSVDLPENHLLSIATTSPHVNVYQPGEADIAGLESILKLPLIAARLKTRRGLHGVVIADRQFEDQPIDQMSLVRFQWLINHAGITLDNVELVEELTEAAQRMREVDRLKTNFLSIVSHELRTPLTSIIGFVHLLKEGKSGPISEGQKDMLARVSNHSIHLQNMVNDILEIAEVESGGIVNVTPQPVDPWLALQNVIPKVEARRSSRHVTIEPVKPAKVSKVYADATALERIYYHLIDNAIKFISDAGRVTIEFEQVGRRLEIAITDTGIGIQPENLKQIFNHFYQVDYRLERAYSGMGIGLTVVKLLLDATGGTLHIESTPGAGSRFTVSYPLA